MKKKASISKRERAELEKKGEQLKKTPDDPMLSSRVGYLFNKAGQPKKASKYLWMAFRSFIKSGQYSMAVMIADELLSIHTHNVEIMHKLSQVADQKNIEVPVLKVYRKYKGFHKIPLFSHLSEIEFLQLLKASRYHDVKRNKTIIKEGAKGDDIYLVVEGRVRVVKKIKRKKEAVVGILGEGDFMGEIAYMSDKRRSASIIAEIPCQLLSWKGDAIRELNDQHPQVTQVLFKAFWERSLDTVLSLSPLFMHMDKEERQTIIERFEQKTYAPKEVVLHEGECNPEEAIYIVKKGESAVFSEEKGSFRRPVAVLKIGDIFGEYSALLNKPCTATVMAKTPLEVFTLQRDVFVEMVSRDSTMAKILEELGGERLQETLVQMPYFQLIQELGA